MLVDVQDIFTEFWVSIRHLSHLLNSWIGFDNGPHTSLLYNSSRNLYRTLPFCGIKGVSFISQLILCGLKFPVEVIFGLIDSYVVMSEICDISSYMQIFYLYFGHVFQLDYNMYSRTDQRCFNLVKIEIWLLKTLCVMMKSKSFFLQNIFLRLLLTQIASVIIMVRFISIFKNWYIQSLISDVREVTNTQNHIE